MWTNGSSTVSKALRPFQFFAKEIPANILDGKFFVLSNCGTVVYGLNMKVLTALDLQTGTTSLHKETAVVNKMELISGQSQTFSFDDSITITEMRSVMDFYLLEANLIVLVCCDRVSHEFTQVVVLLSKTDFKATVLYRKKRIISDITFDMTVSFGLLPNRISVLGSQGPYDGDRETVAHLFAANPKHEAIFPDEQMTPIIAKFVDFLKKKDPNYNIFAGGIFFNQNAVYFLIREKFGILKTNLLGKLTFANDLCELIDHKKTMRFQGGLQSNHLLFTQQRGRNLWLVLDPPNFREMASLSWLIYHSILPHLISAILLGLKISLWFRQWDDGWMVNKYLSLLGWLFGPNYTPRRDADPVLLAYHLDLQTNVLRRADLQVPLSRSPDNVPFYNISCDVDQTGGMMLAELLPKEEDETTVVKFSYFDSPCQVPTLTRLATYRSYRLFPAFERSEQLRYMLGQTSTF